MPIRRITISVPEETASRIRMAAGQTPVSSWVTKLIEEHLDDSELERQWHEFYRTVKPSKSDVREAEALHRRLVKPRRKKRVA
jgi:hypothetical protein